jgi:TP901 family phage tail tape measure protein
VAEAKIRVGEEGAARVAEHFRQLSQAVGGVGSEAERTASRVDRMVRAVDSKLSGPAAQLTGIVGGLALGKLSSDLLKTEARLTQMGIKLGVGSAEMLAFQSHLQDLSTQLTVPTGQLLDAADALLSDNVSFATTRQALGPLGDAMLQTGAAGTTLAKAALVINSNLGYALDTSAEWTRLLDLMTTAGQKGSVELEDLAAVVPIVGQNARAAGLSVEQLLGLFELFGKFEKNKDRLGTLADSFLRPFTNLEKLQNLTKVGIQPFNVDGSKKALLPLLDEISRAFQAKKTDLERMKFLEAIFGKGLDLDTVKALRAVLGPGALGDLRGLIKDIDQGGALTLDNRNRALSTMEAQLQRIRGEYQAMFNDVGLPLLKLLGEHRGLTEGVLKGGLVAAAGVGAVKVIGQSASALQWVAGLGAQGGRAGLAGGAGALGELAGPGQRVYVTNWPIGMGGAPGLAGSQGVAAGAAGAGAAQGSRGAQIVAKGLAITEAFAIGYGIGTFLDQSFGLSDRLAGVGRDRGVLVDPMERDAADRSLTELASRLAHDVGQHKTTPEAASRNLAAVAQAQASSWGYEGRAGQQYAQDVLKVFQSQLAAGKVDVGIRVDIFDGKPVVQARSNVVTESGQIVLNMDDLRRGAPELKGF